MSIRVLIAEDDPELRALYRAQIQTIPGFEIVGLALDESRAVELCTELHPEVVLIGLDDDRNVEETIVDVRDSCPRIKVLLVKGAGTEGSAPAGADRVLARPLRTDTLVTSLLELVDES